MKGMDGDAEFWANRLRIHPSARFIRANSRQEDGSKRELARTRWVALQRSVGIPLRTSLFRSGIPPWCPSLPSPPEIRFAVAKIEETGLVSNRTSRLSWDTSSSSTTIFTRTFALAGGRPGGLVESGMRLPSTTLELWWSRSTVGNGPRNRSSFSKVTGRRTLGRCSSPERKCSPGKGLISWSSVPTPAGTGILRCRICCCLTTRALKRSWTSFLPTMRWPHFCRTLTPAAPPARSNTSARNWPPPWPGGSVGSR